MNNKEYIDAFDTYKRSFVKLINKYDKRLDKVNNKYIGHDYKLRSYGGYSKLNSQINSKK